MLPDDLLAMKLAANATTANHVNRAPPSSMLHCSIQACNMAKPITPWECHIDKTHHFSAKFGEGVASTPTFCFAPDSGTRSFWQLPELLSANIVLKAEKLSTPNNFDEYSLTNPLTSANNSPIPVTKSLLSTQLSSNLSEETSQPRTAKRGSHQLNHTDPQFFIAGLSGGANKAQPAGHRRGCPPRSVTETLLPAWSDRPKGYRRSRPPNTYPTFDTKSVSILSTSKRNL